VRFEQDPTDAKILDNIFRLVHTIKAPAASSSAKAGSAGHAGETLMGKFRDGMPVTVEAVSLILSSIDRIKEILAGLEATETEPRYRRRPHRQAARAGRRRACGARDRTGRS